jgi:anaerobic selenocysteine-containing dehydrogenase
MPLLTTACPRNCYSTCTMRVEVEKGRLRRIEPCPDNRATPEGVCLKGLSYAERVVSPDRLLRPLRRRKRSGSFEPVSWEAALDEIAGTLARLREGPGPRSVLYYTGSGTKGLLNGLGTSFWRLYGGCTTTYGDLCWPAGLEATRLTLGENKHSAPWDLVHARLIVLWGKNAAETNVHQMAFVEEALSRGARLVVVDPRRTETAERAELLLQPRPGTDGALALAVARRLVELDALDRPFLETHVLGFPEFRESLREWTPERAAAVCELPARSIERLAELLAGTRPATICAGFGMQRYTNAGQAMRAILALLVLTGNIGRPGAGWQFANLQSHVFEPVRDPVASFPPERPDGVLRMSVSTARLGRDMLETRDPELRMIWVERGNPVTQNPETNTVLEAFRRLDFRVAVDQFLTDTAREADLVLPAKTFLEQSDVINAYWHPYIQLKRKVLDPPGEVKPESEIYTLLARRLGFPEEAVAETFPAPGEAGVEAWLERRLAAVPGLSLDRLEEGPVLPPGHQEVAFSDLAFPTPSGKIELLSAEAARRWGVDALPGYREPEESARSSRLAARYPLTLMTPNTKNRIHSQFNNLKMIRDLSPAPFVAMHPEDAERRGIAPGDRVRLFNDRGELTLPARFDLGLRPGCLAVTNGWWASEGGAVNVCSLGRETDMGHGAAFHEVLVQAERAT